MESGQNNDLLGEALADYFFQHSEDMEELELTLYNSYGPSETMPLDWFFRDEEDFPEVELEAMKRCRGKVLDIGAGAGSHALYLQQNGIEVTALEISPSACWVMNQRGIKQVSCQDYQTYQDGTFDTILLLMNGIGLIGKLPSLETFLSHMKRLLNPGGQLLFDSSDIRYLFEDKKLPEDHYFGEVSFRFEYKGEKGSWFDWVYIDHPTLKKEAEKLGWQVEIVLEDDQDQYLARLTCS